MKKILNFLDNITPTKFLCIWFPVILLGSIVIAFVVNEYNECVKLLDMFINDKMID